MKTIKKSDLRLDREVITFLSGNELAGLNGGGLIPGERQITDLVGCPPSPTRANCGYTQQEISECMITCTSCSPPFTTRC